MRQMRERGCIMAKKLKSVILFSEWKRSLVRLSLEQKGMLLDALLDYPDKGDPAFDDPLLDTVWLFIGNTLSENERKYEETSKKRSEAGKRGNKKRWGATDDIANIANATDDIANIAISKSKSISKSTDTKVSDSNSAEALPPTPKSRFSPPDVETVKSYFAEKGGTEAQAIRFHAYYESNGWKVGRNPMKNWKAAASGWISRDRDEAKKANAPRNRAFMASRPAEEAENAKNFLADAARRRPLKKQ
ncbi:hypothetical protein HMPREF9436_03357 [Faecalibacterium cf. prausnitzii KLE1255]|uniref:DUF6291 domain-containing protein n=2 Tax=Faecalibacterium prausnitzii TaxID=853 RepID=E2ZNS6_9FIRM|nr:hypothetical protein HMPREF9436_03357 [Faecalibacterium cf. prausnitzii KLE1255]